MMLPVFVSISIASVSEIKSSCTLCASVVFTAIAVPSFMLSVRFFLYVL